jgi:zinc finger protein
MRDLNPFTDSDDDFSTKIRALIKKIEDMMTGSVPFTMILEDPLSNSFLQNPYHPEEDKNVKVVIR